MWLFKRRKKEKQQDPQPTPVKEMTPKLKGEISNNVFRR